MSDSGPRADPTELELFRGLTDRGALRRGIVIGEGPYLAERMLAAGLEMLALACEERAAGRWRELAAGRCPLLVLPRAELAELAGFPFHRGVLAAARRPRLPGPEELLAGLGPSAASLVVCPEFSDNDNLGAIIRAAAGLGAAGVLLGRRCCDPFYRRTIRVSMGAVFNLPIARLADDAAGADLLKAAGFRLAAAVLGREALALGDWRPSPRTALLLGAEGPGLPPAWIELADELVTIPMSRGVDSLNVGAAAAVLLERLRNGGCGGRGV